MALTFVSKQLWMGVVCAAGGAGRGRWGYSIGHSPRRTDFEVAMTPPIHFRAPKPAEPFDAQCLLRCIAPPQLVDHFQHSAPQAAYTTYVTLWMLLFQRLHQGASLDDAVSALLFQFPKEDLPPSKRVKDGLSADNGAYSKARQRLHLETTVWLADLVFASLSACCGPCWKGRTVEMLDGTTFSLEPSQQLRDAFPPPSNQHGPSAWPSLRVVVAHDLATGLCCRPEYGPAYGEYNECESVLARRLLPRLRPDSVVLADGNFGIFVIAFEAHKAGHEVLLRLSRPRFEALKRDAEPAGQRRWAVAWRPSAEERKKYQGDLPQDAQVRGHLAEVEVGAGGSRQTLYLFCTLGEGTNAEWGDLYGLRWRVEPDIGASKVTLGLGFVSARSAEMVEKEVVLASVAYNLVVEVRRQAAGKIEVEPRRLSFKGTLSLVRAFEARVAAGGLSEEELQGLTEKLLRAVGQRKLPNRPGRQYPRELIPRRRRYPERKRSPPEAKDTPQTKPQVNDK
jgi:Transposase DDE domain